MAVILKQKLGDILLQAGYITDKKLEECLAEQKPPANAWVIYWLRKDMSQNKA